MGKQISRYWSSSKQAAVAPAGSTLRQRNVVGRVVSTDFITEAIADLEGRLGNLNLNNQNRVKEIIAEIRNTIQVQLLLVKK